MHSAQTVTFFQSSDHLHLAVSSLELIKEGPHFDLVDGPSLQLPDHHPILLRGPDLQDTPLALRLAMIHVRPVKHLVTLDVWRLLLNLVEMNIKRTRGGETFHFTVCKEAWALSYAAAVVVGKIVA